MSLDEQDTSNSGNTDPLVPVDLTDQPLSWDGNDARILGLLKETWEYLQRNGILVTLIQKRANANKTYLVDSTEQCVTAELSAFVSASVSAAKHKQDEDEEAGGGGGEKNETRQTKKIA